MRTKTDDGKEYYDLWFILEGKGPNRGSVLQAFYECKGGRDASISERLCILLSHL